jgi:hypothetical protein
MSSIIVGSYVNSVEISQKLVKSQVESNRQNAIRIYGKIPTIENNYNSNIGLIVGKVQSGKTSNIISLTAHVFDNEYRIAIMLLSDTNNLLQQNFERIKSAFENCPNVIVIKKSSDGDFDLLNDIEYVHENNMKLIICSLKHHKHINDITSKLRTTSYRDEFCLIVDDEGDDISQNTHKNKFSIADQNFIESSRSKTNEAIINLKKIFTKCAYLSVTATPQAQILLQKFQDLAPNFTEVINPGAGYTGLQTFHGDENNGLVEEIKDYKMLKTSAGLPKSLVKAILFFIIGCHYRTRNVDDVNFKHSMMIHPAKEVKTQESIFSRLKAYIEQLKYGFKHKDETSRDFYNTLISLMETEFPLLDKQNFNDVEIASILKSIELHIINRNNDINDLEKRMRFKPYHIIIGGDLLDRGITIAGLAVTYIIRESKIGQVDTLLQRARWFGYKQDYLSFCKVYLTPTLKNQFQQIVEHEESIWDFLEKCSEELGEFTDQNVEIILNESLLKPTSASKAIHVNNRLSMTVTQKNFVRNKELNNENMAIVKGFFESGAEIISFNNIQRHLLKSVDLEASIDLMSKFSIPEKSNVEENDMFDIIDLIDVMRKLPAEYHDSIDLYLMRYKTGEHRSTINNSTRITALLQGRSEGKIMSDQDYYPGDRALSSDKLSIQFHIVILKNDVDSFYKKNDEVVMISVNFPKNFVLKSTFSRATKSDLQRKFTTKT